MIYFVQAGDGHIKIGFAKDVPSRLAELQTAHVVPLTLLAHVVGDRLQEAALHRRFAAGRVRGEWFRSSPELLAFIAAPAPAPLAGIAPTPNAERQRRWRERHREGALVAQRARMRRLRESCHADGV